ncbi:MAG: hypothetical protein ACLP3C_07885 [Mycobacterium sp.]|uniref:hypothetical protein n=1 Tax=Mycobacterium sp. TaxID=1785 RepID=UPI003F9B14C4
MSNPFDFSDFGSVRAPSRPATPRLEGSGAVMGSETLAHNGFDPFSVAPAGKAQSRETVAPSAPLSGPDFQVARPPLALLVFALAVAAAGIAISGVWGHALVAAAAGWFAAGPMSIGVLSTYTRVDTRRRADAVYSAPRWTGAAYWVVVAVCLSGIGLGAWYLALWAGGR